MTPTEIAKVLTDMAANEDRKRIRCVARGDTAAIIEAIQKRIEALTQAALLIENSKSP